MARTRKFSEISLSDRGRVFVRQRYTRETDREFKLLAILEIESGQESASNKKIRGKIRDMLASDSPKSIVRLMFLSIEELESAKPFRRFLPPIRNTIAKELNRARKADQLRTIAVHQFQSERGINEIVNRDTAYRILKELQARHRKLDPRKKAKKESDVTLHKDHITRLARQGKIRKLGRNKYIADSIFAYFQNPMGELPRREIPPHDSVRICPGHVDRRSKSFASEGGEITEFVRQWYGGHSQSS